MRKCGACYVLSRSNFLHGNIALKSTFSAEPRKQCFRTPGNSVSGVPQVIDFKGIRPSSFSMILGALFRLLSQTPTVPRGRVRPLTAGLPPPAPGAAPPALPLRSGGSPLLLARQKGRAIGEKRGLSDHGGKRLAAGKVDRWVTRNGARKRGVRVIHAGTRRGAARGRKPPFRYSAHGSKTR